MHGRHHTRPADLIERVSLDLISRQFASALAEDIGAGVSKYIAPRALLWFRWAAVATWLTGAYYLMIGYGDNAIHKAFTLQPGFRTIGIGAWLGTIMLFNVWVFIWPNQKKILGLVTATDEEKAKARKVALIASRTNFVLSLPMIMCMGGQSHGLGL